MAVVWRKCCDYYEGIEKELKKEGIWVPHDKLNRKPLPVASIEIIQKCRLRLLGVHHKDPVKDGETLPSLMDTLLGDVEIAVDRICGPRERLPFKRWGYEFGYEHHKVIMGHS